MLIEQWALHAFTFCVQMVEWPEYSAEEEPVRNSPRIARFQSLDTPADYYVFVEQKVYIKATAFSVILFTWFSSHNIFNPRMQLYVSSRIRVWPSRNWLTKKESMLPYSSNRAQSYICSQIWHVMFYSVVEYRTNVESERLVGGYSTCPVYVCFNHGILFMHCRCLPEML